VLLAGNSALRDEQAYPDPDVIRFDRTPRKQLVFGGGPHYCLGAHLAKAELRIGLGLLVERLPTLPPRRRAGDAALYRGEISQLPGVAAVPGSTLR